MKNLFLIFFIFLQLIAFSQEKKNKWDTKLSFGTYYYTGNTEKFDLVSDAVILRKDTVLESLMFFKGAYGEVAEIQNKQEFKGGLKFDYLPYGKLSPFLLVTLYNNKFKDIKVRFSSFLGLKYLYYNTEKSQFSFSAAYQFDADRYIDNADMNKLKSRLSIRPKFKQKIGDNLSFILESYYQPNLSGFDDYIFELNTSLSSKLLSFLSVKFSYNYEYESKPVVETINKLDTSFITSIVFDF